MLAKQKNKRQIQDGIKSAVKQHFKPKFFTSPGETAILHKMSIAMSKKSIEKDKLES